MVDSAVTTVVVSTTPWTIASMMIGRSLGGGARDTCSDAEFREPRRT